MTHKRLTRDQKWGFQTFPYRQVRIDSAIFKGWAAINDLTEGQTILWDYFPKAGKVPVAGEGMCWLTLLPDDQKRSITAFFTKDRRVSAWYIDVIEKVAFHEDGVLGFIDEYLDVMMTPAGDIILSDRDELDAAYHAGELTTEQYTEALREGDRIVAELGSDLAATEKWCMDVLDLAEKLMQWDFTIFLDVDGVLDIFNPSERIQHLLPEAVDRLARLVKRCMAKVVVVSDWRYGSCSLGTEELRVNWQQLVKALGEKHIDISGVTVCDGKKRTRTEEIRKYLAEHPAIQNYVILDDCYGDDYSSDPGMKQHLVFVDALKGLQDQDCLKACAIMNGGWRHF